MKHFLRLGILAAVAAFGLSASTITITYSGTASGNLGQTAFSNADFTLTSVANTDSLSTTPQGVLVLLSDSTTVEISGQGIFSVSSVLENFLVHAGGSSLAGIARQDTGSDLIHSAENAAFGTWDFVSSIGPISGNGQLLAWSTGSPIVTSGGVLVFNNANTPITYQASLGGEAPEPGTVLLLLSGVAMLGVRRFRTR